MSADPGGVEDGANRYAYVANNPCCVIDPTGSYGEPGTFVQAGGTSEMHERIRGQAAQFKVDEWLRLGASSARLLLRQRPEARWRCGSRRITCGVHADLATLAAQLAGRLRHAEGIRIVATDVLGSGRALVRPRGNAALRRDAA